jgi:hypothetical protein
LLSLFVSVVALADETEDAADTKDQKVSAQQPQEMSGMSILGNEETPKSLVIVPWKSSELGENLSISNTLDDRARPVDKEVFLRELRYYTIRSGD